MKLHESPDDITLVLREEPEAPGAAGSAAAINANDFSVDTLEMPPAPEKKQEGPAPAAAAEQPGEPSKQTVTQEKTTVAPTGEKVIEKTIVTTEAPAATDKSAAVARLFNPNTALLMFDIFLTRFGGIFTPERPREYWALTAQDKKDLSLLATESAKEEQWTGIPSKWLLLGALGLMIGGKVVYAKKLEYKFVPGEKEGDPKAPAGSGGSQDNSAPVTDEEYKALFIREKAKHEAEMGYKNNSEEVNELRKQNEYLFNLIEKAKANKTPGGGISDAVILEEEIRPAHKKPVYNEAGDFIFKDSQGNKWNLDKISFTDKGARLDLTKAGLPGWASNGIKLGAISAGQREAFEEWKKYKHSKKVAA